MENPFDLWIKPIKELNKLAYKSMEQITAVQIKAFQENARIGMYALNTATEIKDLDSLKDYIRSQAAVTQYLSDSAAVDAKEINEVGQTFAKSAKKVVEKSITP